SMSRRVMVLQLQAGDAALLFAAFSQFGFAFFIQPRARRSDHLGAALSAGADNKDKPNLFTVSAVGFGEFLQDCGFCRSRTRLFLLGPFGCAAFSNLRMCAECFEPIIDGEFIPGAIRLLQ